MILFKKGLAFLKNAAGIQNEPTSRYAMTQTQRKRRLAIFLGLMLIGTIFLFATGAYHTCKPLPAGLSFAGPIRPVHEIAFYRDLTWVDAEGTRHTQQEIFDKTLAMINTARHLIVLDMFLFNDFIGRELAPYRKLAQEVTEALVARKMKYPDMQIVVITDPINTVYNGMANPYFDKLEAENIAVVLTELDPLRDSNFAYSAFWRIFVKPFGNSSGSLLPNPFGKGRVSLRSYLAMFNFKANHRKVIVCDDTDGYSALITSANPHDGSSAHGNAAIYFKGQAVLDLMQTEEAILRFSGGPSLPPIADARLSQDEDTETTVQIVSESKIKHTLVNAINLAGKGDNLAIIVFYLSDRDVIEALEMAFSRGAAVKVLLDPNKDAFGLEKNGIPNRQAAAELFARGIPVRWGNTHGEQLHSKMLLAEYMNGRSILILGSANFTRRNLEDLNLETNIAVQGPKAERLFRDVNTYIDLLWNNPDGRIFSVDYMEYADNSFFRRLQYRWMEASGMSTF